MLCFDGLVTERASDDTEAGDRAAEAAFVKEGWHAQSWGIEYKIVEKPMFGEQHVDPDEFESAKRARRALQEAAVAYPEVRQAVENPTMHRGRASPAASRNASVIPVSNGRALLTVEVREGVTAQKYGLIGGKGEPGETLAETAAREVSGHVLCDAIAQLEPAAFKECRAASMHIAVAPVGTVAASSSKHVEWVDIAKLLDHQWRKLNMHHRASSWPLCVRLSKSIWSPGSDRATRSRTSTTMQRGIRKGRVNRRVWSQGVSRLGHETRSWTLTMTPSSRLP